MSDDQIVEAAIQTAGATAPRITPDEIDNAIVDTQYHVFEGSMLTVCCLTLTNGFNVTGTSACASPENFNKKIGEQIAFRNARQEIWVLEGYLLKQSLYAIALIKENNSAT
jgi:hypothetical protein